MPTPSAAPPQDPMATTATSLSLPPAPPAQLLDIQSLPSLEKFDSQLLDLIKATTDAGAAGINVMDELQAPDDDLALQRLMSLTRNKSEDVFAAFTQHQIDAAANAAAAAQAAGDKQDAAAAAMRTVGAGQHLRGQLQHHQLLPGSLLNPGPEHMAALADRMQAMQQQQQQQGDVAAQAEYAQLLAAQQQQAAGQQYYHDPSAAAGLQGQGALADALGALSSSNPAGLGAFVESLRTDVSMGASLFAQFGGDLSAALTNLGVPPVDGPSSAVAQRKRANRGTRLSDIIKVEQHYEEGEAGCAGAAGGHDPYSAAAAAAMAAAMQGMNGAGPSDSRDSTQGTPKRRKGANGQSASAAAAAAAAMGSAADSDYEMEMHDASHLHITTDMDEETKTKLRREKNKIAARKCRAKKNALMSELQGTLAGLVRKNDEYKMQVATWHKMFTREVRLREAMKRVIAVMWGADVAPAATGYTANDIIMGIESGTLDINSVMRSFAAVSAANNAGLAPAAAAAAGLATPGPLGLNRSTSAANTPRSPGAAVAAAAAADAAMAAAVAQAEASGGSPAVAGLVPQHLLMSHSSHISGAGQYDPSQGGGQMPHTPHTPHTPRAPDQASLLLSAPGGSGMVLGAAGDANTLGSPIPSVAAAALVDLAAAAGGGMGQGYGSLEGPQWGWGMDGGLGSAPSQVGPSCITTGME